MKTKILGALLAVIVLITSIAVVIHFNRDTLFPDSQIEQPEPGDVEQPEPGIVLDKDYIYF